MKTLGIIILVISSFFLLSFLNNKDKNSLTEDNLKGKVKTLTESSYDAVEKFGEVEKSKLKEKQYSKYNDRGNKIEESDYRSDGSLWQHCIYKYNAKGDKIENNEYEPDGSLSGKVIYKYDDRGNLIDESDYHSDGSLMMRTIRKYDDKGNASEMSAYNADGSLSDKWIDKYDEKGNTIESTRYLFVFSLTYDTPYRIDDQGKLSSKWINKYDEGGNLIESQRYDPEKGIIDIIYTFRYDKFDKAGNWQIKIVFKNNIPTDITERKIEYY